MHHASKSCIVKQIISQQEPKVKSPLLVGGGFVFSIWERPVARWRGSSNFLVLNLDLTGFHSLEGSGVALGGDAGTAARVDGQGNLGVEGLDNHRVRDNADVGAQTDECDALDLALGGEDVNELARAEGELVNRLGSAQGV